MSIGDISLGDLHSACLFAEPHANLSRFSLAQRPQHHPHPAIVPAVGMNGMWIIMVFMAMGSTAQGRACDTSKCPPQHTDVDYAGYDLMVGCGITTRTIANVGSYEDCCAICQEDDECGSFTLDTNAHNCLLKTWDGPHGAHGKTGFVSGDMSEAISAVQLEGKAVQVWQQCADWRGGNCEGGLLNQTMQCRLWRSLESG